ncbi:MAG: sulfatase-like hydrolase/transferase [Bacteroidetes bacterium]|nr:sulfatase-like hydrolase/transferase [Bacteroidota bacterium]
MTNRIALIPAVFIKVLAQIGLLMLFSQLIRLTFFLIHASYFSVSSWQEYGMIVFYSLRFDLSSIFTINFVYIALTLLPFAIMNKKWVQYVLQSFFIISNSVAFIFDIADIGYFPYVRKRMTADVFHLIEKKSDFIDLLPNYLTKFWYVSLLILVVVTALIFFYKKYFKETQKQAFSFKHLGLYLLTMALSVIAIRGGLQLRPITLSNAVLTNKNENIPLIINTPFSILKTIESQPLQALHYFGDEELKKYYQPIKKFGNGSIRSHSMKKQNVVVILLESFGKAFTSLGGRQSYTPFLDSLMQQSMTFNHAFANAYRSADGIPAVLSSIPFFMNEAFPISPYATNKIDALPSLLKPYGYTSSFFHGGANGTMNFDTYCKNAGFDRYIGRNEYHNDNDYDGTWGIWDEPFLQFVVQQLNNEPQPFCSAVFTLSSHEPFALPPKYQQAPFAKWPGIHKGIAYSDMALRKFFEAAAQTDWFQNTLFVITADHHYLAYNDASQGYYNQGMGLFAIPILFYAPNDPLLKGVNDRLIQQIDIMPSVLDYLHVNKPFFSFGNSVFDTTASPFCFTSINDQYYMLQPPYLITANADRVNGFYHFENDSTLRHNLMANKDSLFVHSENKFHAFMQLLHACIIQNKQSYQTFSKP